MEYNSSEDVFHVDAPMERDDADEHRPVPLRRDPTGEGERPMAPAIATTSDQKAIATLLDTYERSLTTADAELAASLYAPEGIFMPLFLPTAEGREILASYRQIFAAIKLEIAFQVDDLSIDGDTAHALTRSEGHVTLLESGTRAPESNRELFVFERHEGDWKIARYMFNKTSPSGA